MQMIIRVDHAPLLYGLRDADRRQVPFALRWAVNALAREAVDATKAAIQQRFTASGPGLKFLLNHVVVLAPGSRYGRIHLPAGTDGRYSAFVGVIPPEGKGQFASWNRYRGSLLAMMEQGGATPGPRDVGGVVGYGRYPIPIARLGARPRMELRLWPINLGLQSRQSIAGGRSVAQIKGKRRTYVVQIRPGESIVFQRFGRGRDDTMPLFYAEQQTQLPARRFFFPTAVRVVSERFALHAQAALTQAIHGSGAYTGRATGWQGPLRALPTVSRWV